MEDCITGVRPCDRLYIIHSYFKVALFFHLTLLLAQT